MISKTNCGDVGYSNMNQRTQVLLYTHSGQVALQAELPAFQGSYSYSLILAPFSRPYSVDSHRLPGTQMNQQCECAQGAHQVGLPNCNFGMSHEDSGGTQQ